MVSEIAYAKRRLVTIFRSVHREHTVRLFWVTDTDEGEHQSADRGAQVELVTQAHE